VGVQEVIGRLSQTRRMRYNFETSTDVRGLPRVVGTFEFDLIIVEFIGPEDELVAFLQLALPDWEESVTWVRNNLPQAWEEGEVRTARGGVQLTLRNTTEPETITVIVAAGQ